MPRESATRRASSEPDLFGQPPQGDLFGQPPKKKQIDVYVPKREHVLNSARYVLSELQSIKNWTEMGLSQSVPLRNSRTDYYCKLLLDPAERAEWRAIFDAELKRLDEATAPEDRPQPW